MHKELMGVNHLISISQQPSEVGTGIIFNFLMENWRP